MQITQERDISWVNGPRDYRRCAMCNRLRKSRWFTSRKDGKVGCKACGSMRVRDNFAFITLWERILLILRII